MDTLQPIKKVKLPASVADMIIKKIRDGSFPPGTKLPPERELMQKLQIGRSTLREALQSLALMGVLQVKPGEGTFIRSLKREDIITPFLLAPIADESTLEQFFEARILVEPQIASLAAKRCDSNDCSYIEESLLRMKDLIDNRQEVDRWAGEFHLRIAYASKNLVCARFVEAILSFMIGRRSNAENDTSFLQWELQSHTAIYKAIANHDEKKAYSTMHKHINEVLEWYRKLKVV